VRLEPDAISSLPYAPLAFGSGLAWIAKREVSARANFEVGVIEDVEVFITATIATENIKNRGPILWTESTVS
jgi:hypothetical protein